MAWSWLWPWRRTDAALTHLTVVMYTRQGCHLCDDAWQCLTDAQRRHDFALSKVDVDTDPELAAQYGLEVPVVTVNGQVRFRGGVNPVLLRRLLEGEGRKKGERRT
jgi:glutaredoxin